MFRNASTFTLTQFTIMALIIFIVNRLPNWFHYDQLKFCDHVHITHVTIIPKLTVQLLSMITKSLKGHDIHLTSLQRISSVVAPEPCMAKEYSLCVTIKWSQNVCHFEVSLYSQLLHVYITKNSIDALHGQSHYLT